MQQKILMTIWVSTTRTKFRSNRLMKFGIFLNVWKELPDNISNSKLRSKNLIVNNAWPGHGATTRARVTPHNTDHLLRKWFHGDFPATWANSKHPRFPGSI